MASSALVQARQHLARLHARVAGMKGKGEEAIGETLAAAEVVVGSAAAGFVDQRWGTDDGSGMKVATAHGVPISLLLGGGGKIAAFMGLAGKHGKHAHDLANGFLGGYGYVLGHHTAKKAAAVTP